MFCCPSSYANLTLFPEAQCFSFSYSHLPVLFRSLINATRMHQKSFFPRKSPRDLRQINNKYPELTNCRPLSVYQPPTISKTYRLRSSFSLSCFLYRHLDDGEPFCWIFLIPDPIDVDGAGITCDLVALFLQEGEEFDIVVVQFLIWTEDLQAGCQRH